MSEPVQRRGLGRLLLSAGGLGELGVAPGTVTSLAVTGLLVVFNALGVLPVALASGLLLGSGIVLGWGPRGVAGEDSDPPWCTADEIAGQALAAAASLLAPAPERIVPLACSFVLYRVFDVIKPLGLKRLEEVRPPWGILLDDLGAGAVAAALLAAALYVIG